jgi:hypothetical protein
MTAVAAGDVTRAEVEAYLDDMDHLGAMSYRKLFEGLRAETKMSADDLLALGGRMRAYQLGSVLIKGFRAEAICDSNS